MKYLLSLTLLITLTHPAKSQINIPFELTIKKDSIPNLPALQSYAWARMDSKILLVGGRTDGLHKRQPFASFNKKFNNTNLIIWDYITNEVWTHSVYELPLSIAEQIQSSNMEFYQEKNILWLIGGYGYSESKKNHITHASVIGIKVAETISAIINKTSLIQHISQTSDSRMAVTGGRMHKMNNQLYLVGGQRFDGRYNPHGPDHGPGFVQEYTNEIRRFQLKWIGDKLLIENYHTYRNEELLHRRDYNLLPQIGQNGEEMLTLYSGVFRYDKDLPYTSLVDITNSKAVELPHFTQKFAHYHTANLSLYSQKTKTQYSIFFGGMAQYYPSTTDSAQADENVPFVKTISAIKRSGSETTEYALPISMDGFFGAASEFIPLNESLFTHFGILDLDKMKSPDLLAGIIIGGIFSNEANVFWNNSDTNNGVSPYIWKIYISPKIKN